MSGLGRTGGFAPGPSRTGGAYPLIRRIIESLESGRGSSWSTGAKSAVFMENMATARVLAFDLYESGTRMSNNFLPTKMTAGGLLPRWETIFNSSPFPGASEASRRANISAAWARIAGTNRQQDIIDALSAALGPVFVGMAYTSSPTAANVWWPAGPQAGYLPSANTATADIPWSSSMCLVSVQIQAPTGYTLAQVYQALQSIGPILDPMIRAWETWQWWGFDPVHGTKGFYLDSSPPSTPPKPNNLDWDVFRV